VHKKAEGGLGLWVRGQRKAFKAFTSGMKSSLNPAKVGQLTAIGFIVDASDYHKKRQKVVEPHDPSDASDEEHEPIHHRFSYGL